MVATWGTYEVAAMRTYSYLLLALFAAIPSSAFAQTIGLGPNAAWTTADAGGTGRTNIEEQFVTLPRGQYMVTSFQYTGHAGASGTVVPFLSLSTAVNNYTPIWVGPSQVAAAGAVVPNSYAIGSQIFTLAANTDVYAGFNANGFSVGHTDPDGPSTTSHNGSPMALVVGTPLGVMTNPDLPRNYAFSISVLAIPEPASIAAWSLMGLVGLSFAVAYRRRRVA
jgi:hypothetical protein